MSTISLWLRHWLAAMRSLPLSVQAVDVIEQTIARAVETPDLSPVVANTNSKSRHAVFAMRV